VAKGKPVSKRQPALHQAAKKNAPRQKANPSETLGRRDEEFRLLLDSIDIGVANATRDGKILYANPRFSVLLGATQSASLAGLKLRKFVQLSNWRALEEAFRRGAQFCTEGELMTYGRETEMPRTIRLSFLPLQTGSETTIGIIATEVTELLAKTKALEASEASVHSLSARLLQVQDDERRKMARDLHDVTGQELAVAVMMLDGLKKTVAANEDARKSLTEATDLLRRVESEIRTLSYVLHPPLLDEMGLRSALSWFIDGFTKRTAIEVEVQGSEDYPRAAKEIEIALFRVIQESLSNVMRHSGSRKAWVRLSAKDGSLHVEVEDRGKGIKSSAKGERSKTGASGVGIQSMRGRVEPFGGNLEVRTGSKGTTVIATIPIRSAAGTPQESIEHESGDLASGTGSGANGRRRVLVVDDHEVARRGIRDMLRDESDFEVCGEAEDGLEALEKIRELSPDVVIMD
jgi:signal transduction histidine kinase